MASRQTKSLVIQIVMGVVIVVLVFLLYRTISVPAERIQRQEELTELTRARMIDIREAMIRYEQQYDDFPSTLDSLVLFVKEDSLMQANINEIYGSNFEPDSLPFSPRTGERFILQVNDTSQVDTYLLRDPDREGDYIGTLEPNPTEVNAASWE